MKALCDNIRLQYTDTDRPELVLTLMLPRRQAQVDAGALRDVLARGKRLSVTIEQERKKPSINAYAYCFVLCQKIAEVIGSTKELVYQKTVRDVGQFEIVPIRDDAVETWIRRWNGKGLGWFAEVLDDSKLEGYKKVISYYGASVYVSQEMAILIDEIVTQCKELEIDTKTPAELESMKSLWGSDCSTPEG